MSQDKLSISNVRKSKFQARAVAPPPCFLLSFLETLCAGPPEGGNGLTPPGPLHCSALHPGLGIIPPRRPGHSQEATSGLGDSAPHSSLPPPAGRVCGLPSEMPAHTEPPQASRRLWDVPLELAASQAHPGLVPQVHLESCLWRSKVWGLVLGALLCVLPQSCPSHGPAILIFFSEGNGYSPICILLRSMDFAVNVMVSAVERHEKHLNENRHHAFRAGSLGRWLQTPGHCPFLDSVSHSLYAL